MSNCTYLRAEKDWIFMASDELQEGPASGKGAAWKRESVEYGPSLRLFRIRFDYMTNPRNQATGKMTILEAPDSVQVVGITPDERLLLVRQYRFGVSRQLLELPGGMVDPGETPEQAARRELEEETGWLAGQWEKLGQNPANPVFMDNYVHTFLATDLSPGGQVHFDEGEDIDLAFMPLSALREQLFGGAFEHPHTVAGLMWALGRLGL